MRLFSKLGLTLFATSSLVLTGCQPFVQKPANNSQQVEAENQLFLLFNKWGGMVNKKEVNLKEDD